MTKKQLKNYRAICAEIADIKQELQGHYAGDTVQSGSKHPYSVHNVRVEGYKSDGNTLSLLARLSVLEHSRKDIEDYINSIDDLQTKEMFELVFKKGKTYLQTVMALNPKMSEDCVRKRIERYLKKH